MLHLENYNV